MGEADERDEYRPGEYYRHGWDCEQDSDNCSTGEPAPCCCGLDDLIRDKERLDWLERVKPTVQAMGPVADTEWTVLWNGGFDAGHTARLAIDAAREKEESDDTGS